MVIHLVQPEEELEFYHKDILDLTQRGAEAIMTKREHIGDWISIFEIVIFHLIFNNLFRV